MKLGNIRRIDELGRLVLPVDIRRQLLINTNDSILVFLEDNEKIVLKKYSMEEGLLNSTRELETEVINCYGELGKQKSETILKHIKEISIILKEE